MNAEARVSSFKALVLAIVTLISACGGGGGGDSGPPAVTNAAPTANAGPNQNVATGGAVTLDATLSSDVNGDTITYAWTLTSKPAGSTAALSSSAASKPTLTPDLQGIYVASLIVNDGKVNSTAATVTITAAVANIAPVANAGGSQSIVAGAVVTLDGTASADANGDALTYAWSLTSKPTGSSASLSSVSAAKPTFAADLAGTYLASLVVNDGKVSSPAATVTVTAAVANAAPIANAGVPQSVVAGTIVTLDGTASSDANGDPLTYAWTLTSKPAASTASLSSTTTARPTFSADISGAYVASLVVNDGKVSSAAATVTVTSAAANAAPVANAGVAQTVVAGAVVTLDGTASSDANGDALTYAWTLTSKPTGSAAILSSTTGSRPTFNAELAGTYVASLVVNDGKASSTPAQATIVSTSVPFDTMPGSWDAIANGRSFTTDSTKLSVSVSGSVLTIRAEQFFDGTCLYTANLTATRDGLSPGTFQCSDFSTGTWQLSEMQRVDQGDIYIGLTRGTTAKRFFGMVAGGSNTVRQLPTPFSNLIGTYDGIATGGPFGTEPASSIQMSITGATLNVSIARFFSGTCQYSATIQPDGKSISAATYQCSDFSTGTWSLIDLRSIAGTDLYISLSAGGSIRRAYGFR